MQTTDAQTGSVVIGVDTGGTFTDVTVLDTASGKVWTAKTSSTPQDPSIGFGNGIREGLEAAQLAKREVARVLHATTVATNLILEGKGSKTGMLVSDGFKYVLEIGRQDVPRGSNLFSWIKPTRPVQPKHILEVPGRIDHRGQELEPLDEDAVRRGALALRDGGVEAVAIVFLHSYASSAHEQRAAQILREVHPSALISLSCEVMPVFREYERSMTTNLNAYVMATVSSYVARLEQRIADRGINAPLLLMKSSGGVTSARNVRRAPVETALSGPAAGIVGANFIGGTVGFRNLIGVDIGGTSADISLIKDGEPGLTLNGRIGTWPIGLPMVDVTTIGAGGGSIARVADGMLTVGPHSAGAQPGPVCYSRGGTEPTVTDAHLVLGHLPPYLLNGSLILDKDAARDAIDMHVAKPLGMDVETAARGILDVADNAMAGAIRVLSVERGHDPRDFVLVPFGGAGPLHGGALARLMCMKTILIPPAPGVLSALGLLVSNLKAEFSRTCVQRAGRFDLDQLAGTFELLTKEAIDWLDREGVAQERRRVSRVASLRYQNQGFELHVPWAGDSVDARSVEETVQRFHSLHQRLYTFSQSDVPVEITTLRVDAVGVFPAPTLPEVAVGGSANDARTGSVTISLASGRVDAPVYERSRLGRDCVVHGPAVLTQLDTTTLLLEGQSAQVHRFGSLIVHDAQA